MDGDGRGLVSRHEYRGRRPQGHVAAEPPYFDVIALEGAEPREYLANFYAKVIANIVIEYQMIIIAFSLSKWGVVAIIV